MANFLRVKPTGWGLLDILASALMNALDIDHAKAINGDDGSTHAPATQIVINGSGMAFGGPVAFATGSGPHVQSGVNFHIDGGATLSLANTATLSANLGSTIALGNCAIAGITDFNVVLNNGSLLGGQLDASTCQITAADFTMGGVTKVKVASRSIIRTQPADWGFQIAEWAWNTPAGTGVFSLLAGRWTRASLRVPHGASLTSITVRWKGAAGHGAFPGGKPGAMPKVELFKLANGVATSLGSASDTSATAGVYEAWHPITLSGANLNSNNPVSIDRTAFSYFIVVTDEDVSNTIAGGTAGVDISTTFTVTAYDEG